MLKKTTFNLIDDYYTCYFSIDSRDNKEYTIKQRTGLLQRHYNGRNHWTGKTHELPSINDVSKHIDGKINLNPFKKEEIDTPFQPAKLISGNRHVLHFLEELEEKWKVTFRAHHSRRMIFKQKNGKELFTRFSHYSILIKVWLKNQRSAVPIEVGEGNTKESKFNQDGLISRLKEIIANHKEQKSIIFSDKIPVILNAGDGGILLHEILGHSLEADAILQKQSPLTLDDIGRQIMPDIVNVTTADRYDTFFKDIPCDDEGETPRSASLVEKGVLKNIITDNFYRDLLDMKYGGHARVEDFTRQPMPRMYALYLKPGEYHPDELMESTKYGVFAREFGEGKINFDKNLFYFNIRDARLIENGKRTAPLGNITVRGNIREVLNSVMMVANDFRYDKGISYCFKEGQTLNVRVGQPTVKVGNLRVTKEHDE